MKVCIVGCDGYLGWSLSCYLAERGHSVIGIDAFYRRKWVEEVGGLSITPIYDFDERLTAHQETWPNAYEDMISIDISKDHKDLVTFLAVNQPDTIIHLGEQPSAPFSMISLENAALTQSNNVMGTLGILHAIKDVCPDAHLIKLATMGEYGTPLVPIPEGEFPEGSFWSQGNNSWPISGLLFPRDPGSFYHISKAQDTFNVKKACQWWGLKATSIMQGVVYGVWLNEFQNDERLLTRFDADEVFGTAINRFVAQAIIGRPLTLYGKGHQKRGFLSLKDSMQCMTILSENPPEAGLHRTVNQLERVYDLTELAGKVKKTGEAFDLDVEIKNFLDPRVEREDHSYEANTDTLISLGYEPTREMDQEIYDMFSRLMPYRDRIMQMVPHIHPRTFWDGHHRDSPEIGDSLGCL
jgi:UDP-sulfoquinovose synthase